VSTESLALIWGVIVIAADIVLRIVALIIVPRNRRPQTALAWLLAIFFIPFVGIVLFLIAGSAKLSRSRRRKQSEVDAMIAGSTEGYDLPAVREGWPSHFARVATLNRALGAMPLAGGNTADLIPDDADALAQMTAAIRSAKQYVHCEFYIMALDDTTTDFFDALVEARSRGVIVRVLVDHLGSRRYKGHKQGLRLLTEAGIEWHHMLPFRPLRGKLQRPDLRNHRKLLVIDGALGFSGSRNIIDPSYGRKDDLRWKDLMARFEGPVVAGLNAIFLTDWYTETDQIISRDTDALRTEHGGADCQVVPSGPGFEEENNLRMFNALVYAAERQIILTSPYFVPDDSMLYAITTAAKSGLDVQLFVGEVGDQFLVYHAQRSYYAALLKAGVRIWLYDGPTILHAKHMTFDDELAVIGSSNLDMRSFTLDLELSVMVRSEEFVAQLRDVQQAYRENSRELLVDEWDGRSPLIKALDNLARLTAAVQ